MEWTDEKMFQLIKLYESQPCLYDVSCKEYHNRNKKKQACCSLAPTQAHSRLFHWCIAVNNDLFEAHPPPVTTLAKPRSVNVMYVKCDWKY